ncbi:MAG: ComF family protein [Xylanivirga thermophila]|uniref:ComF family protein n=1 Tax=Xylanivirga thermophila TaxID=2496273 RepID=UPI00101BA788|nr:ComF family protein [Xylanivirga thermophila]
MDLKVVLDAVLGILYPGDMGCISCGKVPCKSPVKGLCAACYISLPYVKEPRCIICSKPIASDGIMCPDCKAGGHEFIQAVAAFEYTSVAKRMVYNLKYNNRPDIGGIMSSFMVGEISKINWPIDIIIPVPLHKKRERERGYNQAYYLAEGIGREMGISVSETCLIRKRYTPTQTHLGKAQRLKNLQDAFSVEEPYKLEGKFVLLVDDVYTTGATVDACSMVLKENRAAGVYVSTFATGRNMENLSEGGQYNGHTKL